MGGWICYTDTTRKTSRHPNVQRVNSITPPNRVIFLLCSCRTNATCISDFVQRIQSPPARTCRCPVLLLSVSTGCSDFICRGGGQSSSSSSSSSQQPASLTCRRIRLAHRMDLIMRSLIETGPNSNTDCPAHRAPSPVARRDLHLPRRVGTYRKCSVEYSTPPPSVRA